MAVPLALTGRDTAGLGKREYSQAVTLVLTHLAAGFDAARSRDTSATLRSMKVVLDRASSELAVLRAPADAADAQRALVAEFRNYATQVDLLRASVDFGDIATIASHLREITAPAAIATLLDGLRAKGYRIPVHVSGTRGIVRHGG